VGLEFIDRVRKTTLVTGVVIALVLWAHFGVWPAAAFLAGVAWSLVNIHVLRLLIVELAAGAPAREPRAGAPACARPGSEPRIGDGGRPARKLRVAVLLLLKLPVLYGAGYLLLGTGRLPVAGLLGGFAWPLLVIVLKAAGRLILGLDRSGPSYGSAGPVRKGG
jgi:hypothetical protein